MVIPGRSEIRREQRGQVSEPMWISLIQLRIGAGIFRGRPCAPFVEARVRDLRIRQSTATGNPSAASSCTSRTLFWEHLSQSEIRVGRFRVFNFISRTSFARRAGRTRQVRHWCGLPRRRSSLSRRRQDSLIPDPWRSGRSVSPVAGPTPPHGNGTHAGEQQEFRSDSFRRGDHRLNLGVRESGNSSAAG